MPTAALWTFDSPWQLAAVLFAALGEVLALVFVYRVLVRGGSPASTMLWMAVILLAPWVGLLLYYLLPRRLQLRRLRRLRGRGPELRQRRSRAGLGPPASSFGLRGLLANESIGLEVGNEVDWLPGGAEFLRAAAAAIDAAQNSVHCVVYIFRPDPAGLRFLGLLTAAARRGVAVRLLYDSLGSFGLKAAHLAELRAAGGRAEAFLPLLWKRRPFTVNLRNHRKLLVVDGAVAFVGGRNVGDEYFTDRLGRARQWLDAMVAVRGPVVARLHEVFVEDWYTAADEVLPELPSPPALGRAAAAVVCSGPDREVSGLWYALIQAIGEARRSIELCSPYLVPPPMLLFALQLAAARGVRVRVHTNGPKTEAAVLYHAQRSYYRRLLDCGIEIFETVDDYSHSKLLLVDDRVVMVGSANLDLRSASLNFELGVVVVDAGLLATQIRTTLEQRAARFRRLTADDLPRAPFWRAVDGFCALLSPLL
jgi:cardiolipin synthase